MPTAMLETTIHHAGTATLACTKPQGTIIGQATVEVSAGGDPQIQIKVSEFCGDDVYRGMLSAFLSGDVPERQPGVTVFSFGSGRINPCVLSIDTGSGTYRGSKIV